MTQMIGTTPGDGACSHSSGNIIFNGEHASNGQVLCPNDVVTVTLDFSKGSLSFRCNNAELGGAFDRADLPMLLVFFLERRLFIMNDIICVTKVFL